MSQWGNRDVSSNSVLWSGLLVNKTPNSAIRDSMYGNSTAGAFVSGKTVGVLGIERVDLANSSIAPVGSISHTGWVLKTTGSGGRAGRVSTEVLVAGGVANSTGGF